MALTRCVKRVREHTGVAHHTRRAVHPARSVHHRRLRGFSVGNVESCSLQPPAFASRPTLPRGGGGGGSRRAIKRETAGNALSAVVCGDANGARRGRYNQYTVWLSRPVQFNFLRIFRLTLRPWTRRRSFGAGRTQLARNPFIRRRSTRLASQVCNLYSKK